MAYAAVSFLMENVSQLLNSKSDLISGAEEELQLLKNDLDSFRAVLRHAPNNEEEELSIMEWYIKDVVFEAEDAVDSCLTMAATMRNTKSWRRRGLNTKPVNLAEVVRSLREDRVKPLLDLFAANLQNGVESCSGLEEPWTWLKESAPHSEDVEDDVHILVKNLMEHTLELDVISITGEPGVGKSTLAQKIFRNPAIQYRFPTRIWICIFRDFNRKDVFLNILRQLTTQDISNMGDFELGQRVRASLEEAKFLFVVDDLCRVEDWDVIREVLPKENRMSKVLITCRDINICRHANPNRVPHVLRYLSSEECWEILKLKVFGNLLDCPPQLEEIGKSISDKCGGVPLPITVVGGTLWANWSTTKSMGATIDKWNEVFESLDSHFIRVDQFEHIFDVLKLSYRELPDDLIDCFLYLGVFPRDYEISAWTLTRLWIAEGFIQCKDGWSLEETAEMNLMELISRNLVMAKESNSIVGEVKTCLVHHQIRAFCIFKAAIGEHNLFREVHMPFLQMHRRLCIHSHLLEFLVRNLNGEQVRSLLCFYEELFILPPEYVTAFSNAFKLLRVLASKYIKFTKFPLKFTRSLVHLRYFTLSCDDLDVLPETISELCNLQTLVIETESPSLEVRANIWRMTQLRHFKTKAAIILALQGEGNDACEDLQTLTRLSPECCTEQVLNRLPNLKVLGIRGQLTTLIDTKCLQKLDGLEKLKLVNDLFSESTTRNWLHRLPSLPPNLTSLTLSATFLDWEHMSILGNMITLKVLKLKNYAFTGSSWSLDGRAFPRLEFLLIADTNIVHWEVSTYCFPSLRCLVVKNCEELKEIPLGLAKGLEILDIERLNRYAVACAKKIEELNKLMQDQETTEQMVRFKLTIGVGCEGAEIDQAYE